MAHYWRLILKRGLLSQAVRPFSTIFASLKITDAAKILEKKAKKSLPKL